MTNKKAIVNGYLEDISNSYRNLFDEVKPEIKNYG